MKTYDTIPGKLNITQDDVVRVVRRIIKVDGLDVAKAAFRQMNEFFSGQEGWAETTEAVYDLIAEVRRREHLEQHAEQLEQRRAGAPSLLLLNSAEANGYKDSRTIADQMNMGIEAGAEIIHTKTIKKDS